MTKSAVVWYRNGAKSNVTLEMESDKSMIHGPMINIDEWGFLQSSQTLVLDGQSTIHRNDLRAISITYQKYVKPKTYVEARTIKSDVYLVKPHKLHKVTDVRELYYNGDIILFVTHESRKLKRKRSKFPR